MDTAVAELAVIDVGLLVALARLFLDAGNLLSLRLGGLDLLLDDRDDIQVHVEIVVEVLGDEVVDEAPDGRSAVDGRGAVVVFDLLLPHVGGAELGLGLAFEDRFLDLDGDGADDALADVLGLVILLEEVLERLGDGLAVGGQVGPAVAGVLAVDEGGDVLAVAVAVGQDDLDVLALDVDERVERRLGHVLGDEVQEAVLALVRNAVQDEGQALLQVGVVLDHGLDELHVEGIALEHLFVGGEADQRAVLLRGRAHAAVLQDAAGETRPGGLAAPVGGDIEVG